MGNLFIPVLLGGSLLWSSAVQAAPCTTATYDVYLASGFSCSVGNQTYSDFSFSAPANISSNLITVGPAQNALPGNSGLLFITTNALAAPPSTDITLDFTVTATGALIDDATVTITGRTSGGGNIEFSECLGGEGCSLGTLRVSLPDNPTAHTTFAPVSSLDVVKDTLVFGGGIGGSAILDSILELFSEVAPPPPSNVPEPASLVLLASALIGVAAIREVARACRKF